MQNFAMNFYTLAFPDGTSKPHIFFARQATENQNQMV